ncbi:MAG: hypothetical protein AB8B64_17235 [Granulosicoccus sp.]
MKSSTQNSQAEHDKLQRERLEASSDALPSTAVADVPANAGNNADLTATATSNSTSATPAPSVASTASPDTGDVLSDVREMIKILNLDGPDAGRLGVSRDELVALRKGESSGIPDTETLSNVATKLRKMLA